MVGAAAGGRSMFTNSLPSVILKMGAKGVALD